MVASEIDFFLVFDLFMLLLIGMGPKIALVPFLDLTKGMDADTQRQVANSMVRTAVGTALILVVLGWFLMRLLHFTPGAANVAGGIVLLLLAAGGSTQAFDKKRFKESRENWPHALIELRGDMDKLIQNLRSNHVHVCFGNHLQELEEFCKIMDIEFIDL